MVTNGQRYKVHDYFMENKRQKQVTTWVMRCNTVVSPSGFIRGLNYDYSYGVRPVCILKSNIFVSKAEE